MSKSERVVPESVLADREPTFDCCQVCGSEYDHPVPQAYCSPVCGRSQQL